MRPNSDINVTPLVDVVLVLLIIFMVVTPLLEKDIEVRPLEEQEDEAPLPPPDQRSQLVVQISARGELSINAEQVSLDDYQARLKRALAAKPTGERLVFFLPDEAASYGVVVKALGLAKRAGADVLGIVTMDLPAQPSAGVAPP